MRACRRAGGGASLAALPRGLSHGRPRARGGGRAPAAEPEPAPVRTAAAPQLGGGFIEFLFGGGRPVAPRYGAPADPYGRGYQEPAYGPQGYGRPAPTSEPARPAMDPRYLKQVVGYAGEEKPGTVIINTRERFLYLVQEDGKALRYGIGVGRPGFTWAGVKQVSAKREWPDWRPPDEMLKRRPDLPRYMPGGPDNPLGARAMYLGSSLYRIHGSNEPWTIGQAVSSGCIRMRNEDVIDLYERVKVGTKVIVI
ncbi:MAG: L,D-transpeptidase [Xanthobacteraceae bacterium]|nr:L,D-transpeptidase [Xanthobacteraceae bacterium]